MKKWLLLLLVIPSFVTAQDYPSRPVRMLVGFPPGGAMDAVARVLSPQLSNLLGQQFVVENRAGAAGAIAADALVKALADGYTLLLAESGTLIVPSMNPNAAYDPVRQFAPVAGACALPLAFVVTPGFPARNVPELIAALKADPGKHSYASPGIGTLQHLAFELFRRQAGVDAVHVPYKGASAMMPDLMSGQVAIAVISATVAIPQSKSGKIRTLAVTTPQRLPTAMDVPALAETLPGFNAAPNVFVVAPVGTPPAIVQRLAAAVRKAVSSKDVEEHFARLGATPLPLGSEELGAQIVREVKQWAAVVKDAGIKIE
ncbi:MAG TPA: tripartite tricarboxylate transporter substrate-binding protein [Burkholderiales bacterium]|nr:tripartite tricarboxylate transporter substrate-binding protein [Burkholderiales bacterium]